MGISLICQIFLSIKWRAGGLAIVVVAGNREYAVTHSEVTHLVFGGTFSFATGLFIIHWHVSRGGDGFLRNVPEVIYVNLMDAVELREFLKNYFHLCQFQLHSYQSSVRGVL